MLIPVRSRAFKRDVKRVEKQGKDMRKLIEILSLLIEQVPLPEQCRDHPLRGQLTGYRDMHIESDWLLLYCVTGNELHLARTGSHAELFDE